MKYMKLRTLLVSTLVVAAVLTGCSYVADAKEHGRSEKLQNGSDMEREDREKSSNGSEMERADREKSGPGSGKKPPVDGKVKKPPMNGKGEKHPMDGNEKK